MPRSRTARLHVRMSAEELSHIQALASKHNISVADIVRFTLLGSNSARRLPDRDLIAKAVRQASGAAQNINQISRRINKASRENRISADNVKTILVLLKELHKPVAEALSTIQAELVRLRHHL